MPLTLLPGLLFAQDFAEESELLIRINSPYHEDFISIRPDGKEMAFCRSNHPLNTGGKKDEGDIWVSTYDSVWQIPRNKQALNQADFTSPLGYSADGQTFLYNKVDARTGTLKAEVWAYAQGQKEKLNIKFFNNESKFQSGCLSADNRFMIISMQSGATYGVEDLYVVKRTGPTQWDAPQNLGSDINTKFQEITPFLAPDNKTLYFATNGREGQGSFDIYFSERLDDSWRNWSEPKNLGKAINTQGKETAFTFLPNDDHAYFVSTQHSDGYGDIRRIAFQQDSTDVEADTTQMVTQKGPETKETGLRLVNIKTGDPIAGPFAIEGEDSDKTFRTNDTGYLDLKEAIAGRVKVKGYLSKNIAYSPDSLLVVRLEPLEVGRTIQLPNVLFSRGTANLLSSSYSELELVVEMLKENPDIKILLKGHTDNKGDADMNLKLSEERVDTVKDFLVSKGIRRRRIKGQGFGGEEPIASNETEQTRRLNRRVEFEIIE